MDLTRRRGWRPSGWAGQGGGHSEGRSRLRWLGNAEGGGAHREGWGMGVADGHVTSEYGSPGAYRAEKDRTLAETRGEGRFRAHIVFPVLSLNTVSIVNVRELGLTGDSCRGNICGYFGRRSAAAFQQFLKSWSAPASRCAREARR